MNWKQLLPKSAYSSFKRARLLKRAVVRPCLTLLLRLGWPRTLAEYLGSRRFHGRVFLYRQGILSVAASDRFVRFATEQRPMDKLHREYSMWRLLREHGLERIVVRTMTFQACANGKVLETDLLRPVPREEQVAVTMPIVHALMAAAKPTVHKGMPATVEAGLQLARVIAEGALPSSFASEAEIRNSFAQELMTGISHRDIHSRNIMRDVDGRPVLIDLKSCEVNRVVSLDLIIFACKYRQVRRLENLVESAFLLQQQGWRVTELEPVLDLVDLPRPFWAQIFVLHFMGLQALKLDSLDNVNPLFRKLFFRILSRNWHG